MSTPPALGRGKLRVAAAAAAAAGTPRASASIHFTHWALIIYIMVSNNIHFRLLLIYIQGGTLTVPQKERKYSS